MMSRSTFGMYGAYFVITLKLFVNIIFCGVQSYWGGLAATVVLSSIFPSFENMKNTLPLSAAITTQELVGFLCYMIVFTPMMFVHPSKLQGILYGAFYIVIATIGGLFVWAVASNGGAGTPPVAKSLTSAQRSFQILQAISSVAGSWTGACIRYVVNLLSPSIERRC
jgi:NCS1 family nucleobase:cation symporter-1